MKNEFCLEEKKGGFPLRELKRGSKIDRGDGLF